jgi:alanine-synthesizing transaminase
MFSSRLPASLAPSPLASAVAACRAAGRIRADLTVSNPTLAEVSYPETLATAWSNVASLDYTPDPRGLSAARRVVAETYAGAGEAIDPDRLVLTASTSEGYAFLFKLLCDPGDAIVVPAPSYPLLDHLAALESVAVARYALHDAGRWVLDLVQLEAAVTPRTRVVVVVAPNNPTGSMPDADEWQGLFGVCARRGLALIVDEVFAPYRFDRPDVSGRVLSDPPVLTFRLNGLSKLIGLPQAKLAWILVDGPAAVVRDALERLDLVADTFLSVSTPVQVALPALLEGGATVRAAIRVRLERNLRAMAAAAAASDVFSLRRPQGGWTCVLRVPTPDTPDALVRTLLERGVLVHPGYFYDFAHDGYLVVSLLTPPRELDIGLEVLQELAAGVPRV